MKKRSIFNFIVFIVVVAVKCILHRHTAKYTNCNQKRKILENI